MLSDSDIVKFIRLKIPEESGGTIEPHIWSRTTQFGERTNSV